MKQTLITTLVALCVLSYPSEISAQKCKFELDEVDPMEGMRVRRMTAKLQSYYILGFYRMGDDHRLELNVRFVGERNFKVPEGNELQVKLADGEILNLLSAQAASPISYVSGAQVMTNYAISYYCAAAEMERIASTGIAVTRVKLGDETITYELDKKQTAETVSKAACMLTGP